MEPNLSEKIWGQLHRYMNLLQRRRFVRPGPHSHAPFGGGLGRAQARVLCELLKKDGVPLKDLGQTLGIRPASIGELVTKLENGGYVERQGSEQDRRVIEIHLTEKGREAAQKMTDTRAESLDVWFSGLTEEEKEQLLNLLTKLTDKLEETLANEGDADDDFADGFGWGPMGRGHRPPFHGGPFGGPDSHEPPFHGPHGRDGFDFPGRD